MTEAGCGCEDHVFSTLHACVRGKAPGPPTRTTPATGTAVQSDDSFAQFYIQVCTKQHS